MAGTRVSFNTEASSIDNQFRVKPACRVLNGKRFAAVSRAALSRSWSTARCRSCSPCFGGTTLGQGLTMLHGRASGLVYSG